jgi:hypothetical protein
VARDVRDLAREVRELRAAVHQSQRPVVARPTGTNLAPSAPAPATPRADEAAPPPARAAPPTPAEVEALAAARRVVDDARQAGIWTIADRERLHQAARGLRPDDLTAVLQGLAVEINGQRIHLTAGTGPVF